MAHSKIAVRKLATQAEMTLLDASFPPLLKEITIGRLKQKVTRARKLQDKYRDLSRQQRGEARGKRPPTGRRAAAGSANTLVKHEIFAEAHGRFEAQLEKIEAKAAKEAAKAAKSAERLAKTAAKRAKKVGAKVSRAAGSAKKVGKRALTAATTRRKAVGKASRGPRKAAALTRTNSKARQGNVSARGRRKQSRRDSR